MNSSRNLLYTFSCAICIVLMLSLTYNLLTGNPNSLSFRGFLDWLSNETPALDITSLADNTIKDSWGLFDGLRDFINIFVSLFDFALYIVTCAVNLIKYITDFIFFLFVRVA